MSGAGKWSFDDLHIGRMKPSGSSLATRDIPRPKGETNAEWYAHAGKVCALLNKLSPAAPENTLVADLRSDGVGERQRFYEARIVLSGLLERAAKRIEALEAVLDECDEYFDNRADVAADCTDGTTPNQEMRLLTAIREARKV